MSVPIFANVFMCTTKKSDLLLSHSYTLFVEAVASVFPKGEK